MLFISGILVQFIKRHVKRTSHLSVVPPQDMAFTYGSRLKVGAKSKQIAFFIALT